MKFTDFKDKNKEYIYDFYCSLFEDDVDYERTTRSKMLKEIAEYFSNPDNLLLNCTLKEIEYLYNIIHNKKQTFSLCMVDYLNRKMLLDIFNECEVPEEIHSAIDEAYKHLKDKDLIERDEEISILLGILRVHGIMPESNLFQFGTIFLDKKEEIGKLLESKLASWHLDYIEKNDKGISEFYFCDGFVNYYDLKEAIDEYWLAMPKLLTIEEYSDYFYYGLDLSKDYNRKFNDSIKADILDMFRHTIILEEAILGADEDNLEDDALKEFVAMINVDKKVVDKVIKNYPSAAFNGNSFLEYQEILKKQEGMEKKKLEKYEPQRFASIGNNEADIYYALFFALMAYINDEYKLEDGLSYALRRGRGVNPELLVPVLSKFYENPEKHVDEFLADNSLSYNKKERKIIEDFKTARLVHGVLVAYKRDHSEIIVDDCLYAIKGVRANIDEIIPYDHLPCFVQVGLLMYKGNIIMDGIIQEMPISIGPNMFNNLEEEAKNQKLLYTLKERKTTIDSMFGLNEDEDIERLIIKKTKTDLLSSLKNLDKDYAKEYMEENFLENYKEWKEEVLESFKMVFEYSKNNQASINFFNTLMVNENTDNIVFPSEDVLDNNVFLYKENGKLKYYIPDEIKEIIQKEIKNDKRFS